MLITEEYNLNEDIELIEIINTDYLGNFKIKIHFNDGLFQIIDFRDFLEKSQHPAIRKYLIEENFIAYKIIEGNLNWNDYDLIFPLADLYENNI